MNENEIELMKIIKDETINKICDDLFEISACLTYCFPVVFCGSFRNKETCIECYKLTLKQ